MASNYKEMGLSDRKHADWLYKQSFKSLDIDWVLRYLRLTLSHIKLSQPKDR